MFRLRPRLLGLVRLQPSLIEAGDFIAPLNIKKKFLCFCEERPIPQREREFDESISHKMKNNNGNMNENLQKEEREAA